MTSRRALPHLEHEPHARAVAGGVAHGHVAVQGGRHERRLDTALDAVLVGLPELVGQLHTGDSAVHLDNRESDSDWD